MLSLWDTTGSEVVRKLAAERRSAGGVASGLALTLIAVTDEQRVRQVEDAATIAAAMHPCRMLIVVREWAADAASRMDAEIIVGGRLGPCEAVTLRMTGRLALHAESVVMPLLAPDVPVVTWWHGPPPDLIAYDPLGVVAERRITDVAQCPEPIAALQQRAADYAPGDTDLAWTRITPWRTLVAGAFDTIDCPVTSVDVVASADDPRAALLAGWLKARLGVPATVRPATARPADGDGRGEVADGDDRGWAAGERGEVADGDDRGWAAGERGGAAGAAAPAAVGTGRGLEAGGGRGLEALALRLADGGELSLTRHNGTAVMRRTGPHAINDRVLPLVHRRLGDDLAEELRRLDADQPYAAALAAATGQQGLNERAAQRIHIWRDPARHPGAEPDTAAQPDTAAEPGAVAQPHAGAEPGAAAQPHAGAEQ